MPLEESLEARQSNEFEALQAIYGEDLKDLRKKAAWNRWCPLNLSISLNPQRGSSGNGETHVKVDLHVVCSDKYPEKMPEIYLENGKGISQMMLLELMQDLMKKVQEYKGEEMIFQLCQHVEEFLHKHNKPAMKSFYDEMVISQEEKKRQEDLQKQLERDRQRESMIKEVEKRQDLLRAEARLRKERQRSISEIEAEDEIISRKTSYSSRRQHSSSIGASDELMCDHRNTLLLDFNGRSVKRGQCLRHFDPLTVLFSGMDLDTGELVQIAEWKIEVKNQDSVLKNLSSIEQELNYLTKLKHKNLNHYLGFKQELFEERIIVYILMEFTQVSSCHSLLSSQNLKVDIDYLKYITKDVLTALEYLHRNNVVHKSLRDTCVTVNEKGIIKVSDYSIYKRLLDLIHSTHGYYSKKTDIFDFGKFVLHILGQETLYDDNIEIPTQIQSDLYDFLTKCLNKEEKERYTANQLLNHQFFHKSLIHLSPQHVPNEAPLERNDSPEMSHATLSNGSGNSQSRICNEFEILEHLGKGAFGDVLKAKNKLDGGCYAIKRIKLNPKNKTLNKKIVREVTLLSRLNHENVVRYYNSWIETTTIKGDHDDDSSVTTTISHTPTSDNKKIYKVMRKDEFTLNDEIEKLAPPLKNVEISVTYDSKSHAPYDESSDDDSSDDDDPFTAPVGKFNEDSDSDSSMIEFARESEDESSSSKTSSTEASSKQSLNTYESNQDKVLQIDYLYIQMEFCEKSTLRTAIDGNLYLDDDRVWRLFREIVEGLAHIHLQGMIHRDLKPVNIFLDSFDHVKIGDFGLATTIAIRSRQGEIFAFSQSHDESLKEELADESKTGQVGTALYVAPEINCATRAIYNEKVDIYSLGIILFEMSYKPLETAMERIKVLTKLRMKEVVLPEDLCSKKQFLISWLLSHDISKRPTSQELLQSDHLPPPVLEERELQELVRHTLSNPQSKGYRFLISSCFKQTVTPAQDITYDRDPTNPISSKCLNLYNFVREVCVKTFKLHGGQNLVTPLLMPKSRYYEDVESCVRLMTHIGNIVTLSHDLRVPFARYLAWNGISALRRYSVERVCKEKKVFGFVPREFYECAFDIVTPSQGNLMPDAEILYIVYQIINELPGVKNKHFQIRLNHTSLFKAILLHCGVKDKHEDLLQLLLDIKEGKVPKSQLQNFLIHKELSDSNINLLTNFLHSEFEMSKAVNQFQMITKKKSGEAANLAREALQELRTIVQNAEMYGVEFDFVIAPGLIYNIQQYSGMICQFVGELKKKRKHDNKEVVAVGGRYDGMIAHYRHIMEQAQANMVSRDIQQSAVGVSISLDKLVQAVQKQDSEDLPKLDALNVIVCSVGSRQSIKEKTKILRSLWAAGVRCALIECNNTVDCQEQLMEVGVAHAIILKDTEQGMVRLRSWEKDSRASFDRFQEKPYSTSEIVYVIQKILKVRNDSLTDTAQGSTALSRCDSKTSNSEKSDNDASIDVLLVTSKKLSSNARRRCENQVKSHLDCMFKKLTTVIAVDIEAKAVRTLTSSLEFDSENVFLKSVQLCIGKHQKHGEYLNEICEEVWNVKTKKNNPTLFLYSLPDNFYSVIL